MTPQELTICREIHTGLTSKERNNINYLFLDPVDPTYFPDYPVIVKRPMDLRTLKQNLDNGTVYATKEEFYADAKLIFDNAILFNKDRESKFVVDLANRMIKAFDRLRKNAEKKAARLAAKSPTTASSGDNNNNSSVAKPAPKRPSLPTSLNKSKSQSDVVGGKKINIKLKRQQSTSSIGAMSTGASSNDSGGDNEPIIKSETTKLKLKLSTDGSKRNLLVGNNDSSTKGKSKSSSSTPKAKGGVEIVSMDDTRRAQCYKVISSLKRRQKAACQWFHRPVSDPAIIKDYKEKIKYPMDLSSISSKLDKNIYKTVDEFVGDLRLIAANCLQYNTTINDSFRPVAIDFLTTAEELCKYFIAKPESPKVVYPTLLYCWADCVKAIDELLNMTNPEDGFQTAWFFMQPVTFFCGGVYPEGYLDKVKEPIDLGTIVQNLFSAQYTTLGMFVSDCRKVATNCRKFYEGDPNSTTLIEQSERLDKNMEKNLGQLMKLDQTKGAKAREKYETKIMVIKRPEKDFLRGIMTELRAATYTDKSAKITEKATLHFEKPVDTTIFTDYPNYVDTPMDLETVDRKIESGSYVTPEDFEYDVSLIFKNCERYNGPKKNIHMVNLGKHTAKLFRKLFSERMRGGTTQRRPSLPTSANRVAAMGGKMGGKLGGKMGGKRPASPSADERPTKRASIKGPKSSSGGSSATSSKTGTKKMTSAKLPKSPSRIAPTSDPNLPIPMHVAIATIKESYPGRRQNKDLEGWEADCVKFLRQLMKHPWINAERPKYIFHVPVHFLFPAIRESYAAKIKRPMDLTTAEAKLLQGIYQDAEEFISDIALVFSNAITFNKDGNDVGDSMSCAYYEASTHLLKYVRWLSLEVLQSYLVDCSRSPVVESGSASTWKLTIRNRDMARKEMESIVFNELLDKTEPGDKFSWLEQECEKLLKSLRHMSDSKHMHFFVPMLFPDDYTAYIAKPIAWDECNEKLQQRRYNTIGEIVADLRLIFSNALKYNEGARHIAPISRQAYDSAIHMSGKLEASIDKMLLAAGDRIGRERIDMITSHREMEARDRAEEEERKRQWEKEHPGSTMEVQTKLRIVNKRKSHRSSLTDFEFPFYDEEDDQAESDADWLQHAKALYEKQRAARAKVQEIALAISISVFQKHKERAAAKAWCVARAQERLAERMRIEKEKADAAMKEVDEKPEEAPHKQIMGGSCVSEALHDGTRKQIKISVIPKPPKKKKRKKLTSFQ